jgi:hypothetical protein
MRLADLLKDDEQKEARKHLRLAQKIVNSDKRLVIRKRQIQELEKKFKKLKFF